MFLHRVFVVVITFAASVALANFVSANERIGKKVHDFSLKDFRGKQHALSDDRASEAIVIAFLGTECPLVKLYAGRLAELSESFAEKGVTVIGINANCHDSVTEIAAFERINQLEFPILKDVGNQVADQLSAIRTPEVYLLDKDRVIRYHGRIDDQYGIGYARDEARRDDLKIAIEQLLAGHEIAVASTESVGCHIGRIKQADENSEVTYANQISRILQARCVECHRTGEIAPFALTNYDEVVGWAEMIDEVVQDRRMPPWHASGNHSKFSNDRAMSDAEKELIHQWVTAGAPQGDMSQLPEPRKWTTGWQLPREPDFLAAITEQPFRVPAKGAVRYQYFSIDPKFTEDKWVDAVEIRPGNRAVVHHVLMFTGTDREIRRRFGGGARGYDGIYVPGQRVEPYPTGMAKKIKAGSRLVFQVHYTPIGTEQLDQTHVGMTFVDADSVKYEVRTESAAEGDLKIPPNAGNHRVEAGSPRLPFDAQLIALNPHMHLRGKSFSYEAVLPNGTRRPLIDIPQYDFNWQTAYRFAEPLHLPSGTRIHCVAHFDNSADNLNNPDPDRTVRWGEQTWDEMMIGYYDYAIPIEKANALDRPSQDRRAQELFDRFDKNSDGKLLFEEVGKRERLIFKRLDADKDGELTIEELSKLFRLR